MRLTIEFEATFCNLRCRYCWTEATSHEGAISLGDFEGIIVQAKALGTRTIVLTGGGEPLIDMVRFNQALDLCTRHGLWVVVYTNGLLLSDRAVSELLNAPLSIVGKLNVLGNADFDDWFLGKSGAHERLIERLEALVAAGWSSEERLAVNIVVSRWNCHEITLLWRWCRRKAIVPFVEIAKVVGKAKALSADEFLLPSEARTIFEELSQIDLKEFGYRWIPRPPIAPTGCNKWYHSLFVSAAKDVYPCAGVRTSIGNLSNTSLKEIVESPIVHRMRTIRPCFTECCRRPNEILCYGCRANAYSKSGDMFDKDPFCWLAERNYVSVR